MSSRPSPSTDGGRPGGRAGGAATGDVAEVVLHGWGHGGEAVGRLPDGRAVFVPGALPDEVVRVRVTRVHKRHAQADLLAVLEPSPHRVTPPCPYVGRCGGCQLQHAAPDHQLDLKTRVVIEQLQRIGRIEDPPVRPAVAPGDGRPGGYRTWARMGVDGAGRLGFRRAGSDEVTPIDRCLLLTPAAQALRDAAGDRWVGAAEVSLMAGDDAGLLTVTPHEGASPVAPDGAFGVARRRGRDVVVERPPGEVTVTVDGTPLRASAGTFFQAGPGGAALLVRTVLAAADVQPEDRVLDLYCGVGLLSGPLAVAADHVVAVEADPRATADARHNLTGRRATVVTDDVARALDDPAVTDPPPDVVVLDPPRTGAGGEVCRRIGQLGPRRVVYVACDPAALARDLRVLVDAGFELRSVDVLDLFGHTAHVEAVALLERR